ncbi:MAG: Lipid export ATP-binding/permease protein MsbA [Myxococcaceae bacterium]|nr:Lipid export ATP-binding/permease protein MsbA [Myxococcaceae bacterium]
MSRAAAVAPKQVSRADRLLAQFHEETPVSSQAVDWQMLRDLLPYAKRHKALFSIAFALMPIGALAASLQPLLLQRAINATGLGAEASALGAVIALYALLVVVRFTASFAETYAMQLAGQRTMADLRMAVFGHIQRLSIRHFDRTPVGRIVTRVTNDIDSMGELFASGAVTAIGDLLLLTGIMISMLWLDAELSLVAFAVIPPLFFVVEFFRRQLRTAQRLIRARTAQLNAFLNEQVQGIQVVQAFSRERECSEAYADINREYREANRLSIRTDALMFSAVDMLATLAVGLVLWYAARRLHLLGDDATAERQKGTFVAFYAYIQQFFVPVRDLSTKYTMIQSAFASAERVFGLLSVRDFDAPVLPSESSTTAASAATGDVLGAPAIAFADVVFRYKPNGAPVLSGVSFTVARGETVAIVGATGAGKTTVTGLVQRFYDVESGSVSVAGRDVRSFEREALRSRFAVVQQDVFLFSGDLLTNIALGVALPDRTRAEAALMRVGAAHSFASRGGLDMRVAERGQNLSAGERQLVSFARALYRDPELLILDEATANIDSETEARLQHAVDELLEGRTAIVIAHRLSTVRRADRILVFHHGQIVEQGTHAELLATRGVYARLYQLQFAEPESEEAVAS